ncbi:MAG: sel1 repeat family protein [Muribaculaceae bacterium]|nr:sel1 repeat family protein [Muribaculaceae bacterium]
MRKLKLITAMICSSLAIMLIMPSNMAYARLRTKVLKVPKPRVERVLPKPEVRRVPSPGGYKSKPRKGVMQRPHNEHRGPIVPIVPKVDLGKTKRIIIPPISESRRLPADFTLIKPTEHDSLWMDLNKRVNEFYSNLQAADSLYDNNAAYRDSLDLLYNSRVGEYSLGDSVTRSLLHDLALSGSLEAQYHLASMCLADGVNDRDSILGKVFILHSAKRGHPMACYYMGVLEESGELGRADTIKAVQWYDKAASAGVPLAMCALGDYYRNSNDSVKDLDKAKALYEQAANAQDGEGYYKLALLLSDEDYVSSIDWSQVAEYLRCGAELGNADAQLAYGKCLKDGRGVPVDTDAAIDWLIKASMNGRPEAVREIDALKTQVVE